MGRPLACRLLGCTWDFRAEDAEVLWTCARGCGRGGHAPTAGPEAAARLVRQLERGRPGPPLSLLSAMAGTVHRPRGGSGGR
ncbi:hypothetical protein [Streptomyces sp. JJ36]|uniref:hypothetical protein n=1 Tax=Streptomyces sp. JJ36 TaxID=2736645 RepID=UPI001F23CFE8|nr:hypothetical protein [Streptomyces sp. JJ36]MCF6524939.1 hypothetical protein [Streptomyces sp. JJ36]